MRNSILYSIILFLVISVICLISIICNQEKSLKTQRYIIDTQRIELNDYNNYYLSVERMLFWCNYDSVPKKLYDDYLKSLKKVYND